MRHRTVFAALALLICAASAGAEDWRGKVDRWVLDTARTQTQTEFLVLLSEQAVLTDARSMRDRESRGRFVVDRLRSTAESTQAPILDLLRDRKIPHRSFWIANMLWVRGDLHLVQSLAERFDVERVLANPRVASRLPEPSPTRAASPQGIEWNLVQIGAPAFWAAGHTGAGVVIGAQDTGYDWQHPALKDQYRGWNGLIAEHDFNWHDAIHRVGPGSVCGADSPVPCDDYDHGTHTLGIMIGDDGSGNQIGVAPGARWIGCRNMDEDGVGSPASYAECFQFFLAPTRLDGTGADPSRAPHVINNSWACPPAEGCTDPLVLQTVVENARAAGIVVVASAGNDGPTCSSLSYPPAIYEQSLTVGATDSADEIWISSSRGGVTVDGTGRLKPNVVAPGVQVRSSLPGGGYASWSGTSMAGPHVAGQIALLISAVPALAGRTETLETCVEATAVPLVDATTCSGIPGNRIPNNTYGRGRVELALPLPVECSASFIFADDFETGQTSGWSLDPLLVP